MTKSEERLSRLEGVYEHLATKADVESVRVDVEALRVEVETVKVEVRTLNGRVDTLSGQVDTLRVEMARQETRVIKWMVGTVVAGIATATAVAMAVERLF